MHSYPAASGTAGARRLLTRMDRSFAWKYIAMKSSTLALDYRREPRNRTTGRPNPTFLNFALELAELQQNGVYDSRDHVDDRDDLDGVEMQFRSARGKRDDS